MAEASPLESWTAGEPYERYVGRWSRKVAELFLTWLAVIQDDPPDNRYLECAAVEGGAAYLVSGDRLLLALGTFQGIPIVSPRVFLEALEQGRMDY